MGLDGLFLNVFLRGLLLKFCGCRSWNCFFACFWCGVCVIAFLFEFAKRFCLRILSGWAAGRGNNVVLKREWGMVTFW